MRSPWLQERGLITREADGNRARCKPTPRFLKAFPTSSGAHTAQLVGGHAAPSGPVPPTITLQL